MKANGYWIIAALIIIDLTGAGWQAYQTGEDYSRASSEVLKKLNEDPDYFRIYSPSYSLAQHEAVFHSIEMADGVDPLQIASYANFMEKASGAEPAGYSVTIPAFMSGNPDIDNIDTKPDAELLGLLNVKYVVSEFPVEVTGLQELNSGQNQYLYLNEKCMPRAWIEPKNTNYSGGFDENFKEAEIIFKSPNKIILEAEGPGKLVLSEIYYPGWKAYIDRSIEEISRAHSILRAVDVPSGRHEIVFVYRPISVFIGIILALIGWSVFIYNLHLTKRMKIEAIPG